MKKCSFMFHRRENCLGSSSADYSCKTLCEFWEDLLNYWAVFKQVVRKYFRIHIPSVWLNFTFRQYTTIAAAAVWKKLLQNWKLRSSWFQTNIKQSCTTSKQLIWWRHRKYICRTTKQNICYLRLCLVSVGLFYPSHWWIHLIQTKGASPQGLIHHQMVSESWNFTGRAQMCALRQKCF